MPSGEIIITQKPMLDSNVIAVGSDATIIQCSEGEMFLWKTDGRCHGLYISDGWLVHVLGDFEETEAINIYKTIHPLVY